jgi:streptogramin lyase
MRQRRNLLARATAGLMAGALAAAVAGPAYGEDAPSEASSNLLADGGFEDGTAPEDMASWTPWSERSIPYFTTATDQVSEGAQSLRLLDDSTDFGGGMISAAMDVEPSTTYEVNLDVLRVSGSFSVWAYFYDDAGEQLDASWQAVPTAAGAWERAFLEYDAPADAASAKVMIYSGNAARADVYVDDMYFGPPGGSGHEPPPEPSPQDAILEQDENLEYLGTPVTTQIPSQAAHGVEDGRHVSYQVFKGNPASGYPATFAVTDVETGDQVSTCVVEGAEHARNLNIADDGRVYWGTYYDSKLWRHDPATGACEDLGRMSDQQDSTFGMSPGPDDSMYIGSYPGGRLLWVDPVTDEVELLREIAPNADYIHAIAYHAPTDTVYVGSGGQVPQIWKITDGGRGEQTLIADESTAPGLNDGTQFVGRMDLVGDRLFAQVGLRMLILDLDGNIVHWDPEQTRYFFGHHAIAGAEPGTTLFSTSGGGLVRYDHAENSFTPTGITIGGYLSNGVVDDSGGTPLLYGTSASGVFVADLAAGTLIAENAIQFAQPTLIQKLFTGPDDSVWASGYMVGLAEVDKAGVDHDPTMQRGQFESATVRDGKLYLGGYGHARFDVLDPATYDPAVPGTVPTLFDGADEGQDRPFGMAYNPDRDEIYMGSVAIYGQTQGGLAIWDGATGEHEWLTTEIGADENIVSVVYNPVDGMVYLGSTVDGGLGSDPSGNTAGKLIVLDPQTRSVVTAIDPIGQEREGITGLMVDDDGLVWGVAEEALFAYDPATGESEVKGSVGGRYSAGTTYWAYGTVTQSTADGKIYVTAGRRFSVHDPATGETTRIANGLSWSTVDGQGDVYLSSGAMLFRYNVPGAALTCTDTVTDTVDGRLVVGPDDVTCLDGARVSGTVEVRPGGALLADATSFEVELSATDAQSVQVRDSSIRGAVTVTGTTGEFVFSGNDVRGALHCSGNAAAPDDEGRANALRGSAGGQCSGL